MRPLPAVTTDREQQQLTQYRHALRLRMRELAIARDNATSRDDACTYNRQLDDITEILSTLRAIFLPPQHLPRRGPEPRPLWRPGVTRSGAL